MLIFTEKTSKTHNEKNQYLMMGLVIFYPCPSIFRGGSFETLLGELNITGVEDMARGNGR